MGKCTLFKDDRKGTPGNRAPVSPQATRGQLVVEHADGWIENVGEVELRLVDESPAGSRRNVNARSLRLQWQSPQCARQGAALVAASEIGNEGPRRPLEIRMRNGERQYWFFGAQAAARLSAQRFNDRVRSSRRLAHG